MQATVALKQPLLRGERRPRVALVGRARTGKSTIFQVASSVAVRQERLAGLGAEGSTYEECVVELGLEQISLVDLPPLDSLHRLREGFAHAGLQPLDGRGLDVEGVAREAQGARAVEGDGRGGFGSSGHPGIVRRGSAGDDIVVR